MGSFVPAIPSGTEMERITRQSWSSVQGLVASRSNDLWPFSGIAVVPTPAPKAKLVETIPMNTDDRWDATRREWTRAASQPGARLYKRRLKSTKERIRITEVLPTRGPLFAFSLAFMGCAAGRSINTIIPDAIMSYRAIVSSEAYRPGSEPLNARFDSA